MYRTGYVLLMLPRVDYAGGKLPSTSVAAAMELIKSLLLISEGSPEPPPLDAATALIRRFSQVLSAFLSKPIRPSHQTQPMIVAWCPSTWPWLYRSVHEEAVRRGLAALKRAMLFHCL